MNVVAAEKDGEREKERKKVNFTEDIMSRGLFVGKVSSAEILGTICSPTVEKFACTCTKVQFIVRISGKVCFA